MTLSAHSKTVPQSTVPGNGDVASLVGTDRERFWGWEVFVGSATLRKGDTPSQNRSVFVGSRNHAVSSGDKHCIRPGCPGQPPSLNAWPARRIAASFGPRHLRFALVDRFTQVDEGETPTVTKSAFLRPVS
jgi:hypothetical protein